MLKLTISEAKVRNLKGVSLTEPRGVMCMIKTRLLGQNLRFSRRNRLMIAPGPCGEQADRTFRGLGGVSWARLRRVCELCRRPPWILLSETALRFWSASPDSGCIEKCALGRLRAYLVRFFACFSHGCLENALWVDGRRPEVCGHSLENCALRGL